MCGMYWRGLRLIAGTPEAVIIRQDMMEFLVKLVAEELEKCG